MPHRVSGSARPRPGPPSTERFRRRPGHPPLGCPGPPHRPRARARPSDGDDPVEVQLRRIDFVEQVFSASNPSFQIGSDDAEDLSMQYEEMVSPKDILSLPKYHAYARLMIDGIPSKPFSVSTLPPPELEQTLLGRAFAKPTGPCWPNASRRRSRGTTRTGVRPRNGRRRRPRARTIPARARNRSTRTCQGARRRGLVTFPTGGDDAGLVDVTLRRELLEQLVHEAGKPNPT
mgnify:CR=1 FL=1